MRLRILLGYLCALAAFVGPLAAVPWAQDGGSGVRLVNIHEGMKLVNTARKQKVQVKGKPDCSHLVHQIYELSGFPYPYASSFDLYDGIGNFRQVSAPRPGDLVVWRGHVGILINAVEHTFYSSVSSGFRTENYDGPYWREQGRPRFYRYVLPGPAELTAINTSVQVKNSAARSSPQLVPVHNEIADAPSLGTRLPTKAESPAISPSPSPLLNHQLALPSSIM
ncbi:MAG TPA: NlpC/P60 family protein, partial [Verrucomicrobiae bacterium]|nr:NlpC/P60 family protein [Verrucomicrobiae bacterium]